MGNWVARTEIEPRSTSACDERDGRFNRRNLLMSGASMATLVALGAAGPIQSAQAQQQSAAPPGRKPNILIIWGDDIGWFNASCYHGGVMGYQTPNIDRIAGEGARFTDWYGQ